jgi:hypothetical protein
MVETPNGVSFDPTGAELRPTMRTAERHQVRDSTLAAVQREILAHDPNRLRPSGGKVLRSVYRLPEPTQKPSGQRAGARALQIRNVVCLILPTVTCI